MPEAEHLAWTELPLLLEKPIQQVLPSCKINHFYMKDIFLIKKKSMFETLQTHCGDFYACCVKNILLVQGNVNS